MHKIYTILLALLLLSLVTPAFANILLPNGEAPYGIQYDANSDYLGQHRNAVSPQDQNNIDHLSLTYNVLTIDIPAKFAQVGYTGNTTNDFNLDAYKALCAYAYSKGMVCAIQVITDGTGYLVDDYNTLVRANFSFTAANPQNNYPSNSPSYTTNNNEFSMWDNDYNTLAFYQNFGIATQLANNPAFQIYITQPNEGFYTRLSPELSTDQNAAWHVYLNTKYDSNVTLVNQAYGTSYANINAVGIPWSRTYPVQQQIDWWNMRNNRAISIYADLSRALSLPNSNKIVLTVKMTGDYMYPSGAGDVGFSRGIDTNLYIATTNPYIDAIACDPYSSESQTRLSAVTYELRFATCKALGDSVGKPVYLTEWFNSVDSGASDQASLDANINSQMIAQTLSYVGSTLNSGIRGASVFTYDGGYPDDRDIKGTANETLFSQLGPTIKTAFKNTNKSINTQIAFCDNTTINISLLGDFYRREPLFGFLDMYRKNDNNTIKIYLNTQCAGASEPVMYANQIQIQSTELVDLNTWLTNGGTLITGYRFADGNEQVRSTFGGSNTRSALANFIVGTTGTVMEGNKNFDVNVAATHSVLTLPTGTVIFDLSSAIGDLETSSLGTGATAEARVISGAYINVPVIVSKAIGTGKSIHIGFNLYESFTNSNSAVADFNATMRDIIQNGGKTLQPTTYVNYYAWTNPYLTGIVSYGPTSGSYLLPTSSVMKTIDFNNITQTTGTTYTLGITSGKTMISLKDGNYFNPITSISGNTYMTSTTGSQIITLTCIPTINSCSYTTYNIDGGSDINYTIPFTISSDGNHIIRYFSTDIYGNRENTRTAYASIDSTQPSNFATCVLVSIIPLILVAILIILLLGYISIKTDGYAGMIGLILTVLLAVIVVTAMILSFCPIG